MRSLADHLPPVVALRSRRATPLQCAPKQRMVCPCGVSSVALFTLPAAFAKFNALPAPKKKAAALFLVPVVAVLTALCVLRQTLPPLAPHPFSRVWATRAAAVLTPCGLSLQVSQAWLRLLLLRVCPDPEHGPWLCGSLAPGNQERSGFWLLAAVREGAGQEREALERCAQLEAREVARPSQTACCCCGHLCIPPAVHCHYCTSTAGPTLCLLCTSIVDATFND